MLKILSATLALLLALAVPVLAADVTLTAVQVSPGSLGTSQNYIATAGTVCQVLAAGYGDPTGELGTVPYFVLVCPAFLVGPGGERVPAEFTVLAKDVK